ncbi:MAG: Uma2 family endonuclease [Gammaproteobacteria bacterium]
MLPNAKQDDLYAGLMALGENLVGEIVDDHLHVQPRPTGPHALVCSSLEIDIGSAYHKGRGGPGGWWILMEPEIHFTRDTEVLVPDIAGWHRERMPRMPEDQRFEVVPDWVCEVLSPTTAKKDRTQKMPAYARYSVNFLWLVDPLARTLETFELQGGRWLVSGLFKDNDIVSVPPFPEIALELSELWVAA